MHLSRLTLLGTGGLMFSLVTLTSAQTAYTSGSSSDIRFQWAIPEAAARSSSGNIYFQLRAPESYAWVGLGIGSGMAGADIFIIYQDGSGNVTLSTRTGVGEVMPEYVERPDIELLAGSGVMTDDGYMVANIRCGACANRLDLAGTNDWIAAWQSGNALNSADPSETITIHDGEAELQINFAGALVALENNPFGNSTDVGNVQNDPNTNATGENSGTDYDSILLAHGVIMTIVFIGLYPLGALLMPLLGNWLVHASFQIVAFLLMWAGFALGYMYAEHDGYLWKTHPLLGVLVVALLGLQPVFGWLHHRHFTKHHRRGPLSHIHVWYGRALMVIGIVNGGLGLEMSGKTSAGPYMIAYCVVAGAMGLMYVVSAVFGVLRTNRRKQSAVMERTSSGEVGSMVGKPV